MGIPGLRGRKVVPQRTAGELDAMAAAGALVARALAAVREAAALGVSTLELDEVAESVIRDGDGVPSFLGYHGFPATICASVNDRVVHGIPTARERLAAGDLVSIDCGAIVDGWHGDSAITFGVGPSCTTAMRIGTFTWPGVPFSPSSTRPSTPTFTCMVPPLMAHSRASWPRLPW